MIRDGRIQDAKAIMLLQWAVLDGPFAPGQSKDSPRTRQSLVTLATFPSWGSWPGCRLAESWHQSNRVSQVRRIRQSASGIARAPPPSGSTMTGTRAAERRYRSDIDSANPQAPHALPLLRSTKGKGARRSEEVAMVDATMTEAAGRDDGRAVRPRHRQHPRLGRQGHRRQAGCGPQRPRVLPRRGAPAHRGRARASARPCSPARSRHPSTPPSAASSSRPTCSPAT